MRIATAHTSGIEDHRIVEHVSTLGPCTERIRAAKDDGAYAAPESALHAPFDSAVLQEVQTSCAGVFRASLKSVILVGIGGSDLGTRAVYDALYGHQSQYGTAASPTLYTFSTIEPRVLHRVHELITRHERAEEVALVIISKSGSTVETLANANVLFDVFSAYFGAKEAAARTLVITDPGSALATSASEQGMRVYTLPHAVGGRYSVFTVVGLVPLALLGVDVALFCEGARAGIGASIPEGNEAAPTSAQVLAAILYEEYTLGTRIHELFMFNPALETLGKWYRQLLAESIGKGRADGTLVGILPTVAIGSTDLHSLGQLILGGPKDRYTTFIADVAQWEKSPGFNTHSPFYHESFANVDTGAIINAIYEGTQKTYLAQKLPFTRIDLESNSPRDLAAFMGVHMVAIMYLAELLGVNAFDQPNVEQYKQEARNVLHSLAKN